MPKLRSALRSFNVEEEAGSALSSTPTLQPLSKVPSLVRMRVDGSVNFSGQGSTSKIGSNTALSFSGSASTQSSGSQSFSVMRTDSEAATLASSASGAPLPKIRTPPGAWGRRACAGFAGMLSACLCALRALCRAVDRSRIFSTIVYITITVSCVNLALDSPDLALCDTSSCQGTKSYLFYSDIVTTSIFMAEMAIQLMWRGAFRGPDAYFRGGWRCIDALTTVVSIVAVSESSNGAVSLRVLRALRALRPLRLVSRMPQLRLVVDALLTSFP